MTDIANLIPDDQHLVETKTCDRCKKPFLPRTGTGGRPQRFCTTACKDAFHSEKAANVANVGQRESGQAASLAPDSPHPQKIVPTSLIADMMVEMLAEGAPAEAIVAAVRAVERSGERPPRWQPEAWSGWIPPQLETWIETVRDGNSFNVQITQESDRANDPDRILIRAPNVIAFCRGVIWAAGFENVSFSTRIGGGYVDIVNGDECDNFNWPEPRK